nr:unnamed protein product [Callosobruchus analis]
MCLTLNYFLHTTISIEVTGNFQLPIHRTEVESSWP